MYWVKFIEQEELENCVLKGCVVLEKEYPVSDTVVR
jgi:hypothetical protein